MIATVDWAAYGSTALGIIQAALGLGFVIFVHELGHFAVAKMCGVKCEKFFIGFDIGGYKISRKWGETEYGIGILPLGGYVKMLGQDDNPANYAEQVRESMARGEGVDAKEIVGPDGQKYLVDRRSYMAKTVPQRMAIISAGVIMNVIFAFIFAVIAYGLGVPYTPAIIAATGPGSPAWRAGLKPGDEIVKIGDIESPSFNDLQGTVTLADLDAGVPMIVRRGDETLPPLTLTPEAGAQGGLVRIGVAPPRSLRLSKTQPVVQGSAAASASPPLEGEDEIIEVNGQPVSTWAEFASIAVQHASEALQLKVRRGAKPPADDPDGKGTGGEEVSVTLPPQPMRRFGLVMAMGKVAAVQDGSPAAEAGIKAGDFIDQIVDATEGDGGDDVNRRGAKPDPLVLPDLLRKMASDNRSVAVTVRRDDGGQQRESFTIPLREVDWMEDVLQADDPVPAPSLGVAYRVLNVVDSVVEDSPAAKAGLRKGDMIVSAKLVAPPDADPELAEELKDLDPFQFNDETQESWAGLVSLMQSLPPGASVKLKFRRGEEEQEVAIAPEPVDDSFDFNRGLAFVGVVRTRVAATFAEQVRRGWDETVRSLGLVYRFLRKIGEGQVPIKALGGPVTIANAAYYSASGGLGKLLVFLTILSANLAVINFLPIPILDGGHMVFLAYEGIRGRPASEKFVVGLHAVGFALIISLMLFVLALDLGIISRGL